MQLYMEHPLHGRMPVTQTEVKANELSGWKLTPALTREDILKLKGLVEPKVVEPTEAEEVDTPEDAYERKFGKKPHHLMKLDTVIKRLES